MLQRQLKVVNKETSKDRYKHQLLFGLLHTLLKMMQQMPCKHRAAQPPWTRQSERYRAKQRLTMGKTAPKARTTVSFVLEKEGWTCATLSQQLPRIHHCDPRLARA